MSDKLEFTGERFTPECVREIMYEHVHRYALAANWCEGAKVLDAACGEGYGSALLARRASAVRGVDNSESTIAHARRRYGDSDNVSFQVADVTRLPFADASFDRVVSFETLEHLGEQEALLREFRRVLRQDGFLILSSPDKAIYSDRHGFDNEFHVRELYREELEGLLGAVFPAFRVLGQKLMFHSVIWHQNPVESVQPQMLTEDQSVQEGRIAADPVYLIALCAADQRYLPELAGRMWLFADEQESVYAHYYHEIRKNMAAGALMAERDAEIAALRQQIESRSEPWWRRWIRRD